MAVTQVVWRHKRDRCQLNGLSTRILTTARNVRAPAHQDRIVEQVVGRPVFLEDDHNMVDLARRRWLRIVARDAPAAVQANQKPRRAHDDHQQQCHVKPHHTDLYLAEMQYT
jgi:hypothetical protein